MSYMFRSLTPKLTSCSEPACCREEWNQKTCCYDYIVEINVQEFHPSDLKVSVYGHRAVIEAVCEDNCCEGSHVRHNFSREIRLPCDVIPEQTTSLYKENGILEIRTPFNKCRGTNLDITTERGCSAAPRVRFVDECDRPTICAPSTPRPTRTTMCSDYTRVRSTSGSPRRSASACRSYDVCSPPKVRQCVSRSHSPVFNSMGACVNPLGMRYSHKICIDPCYRPEEISVVNEDGVVIINAKTGCNGPSNWNSREFSYTHVLPSNVDSYKLSAKLLEGEIYLDAPYKCSSTCSYSRPCLYSSCRYRC